MADKENKIEAVGVPIRTTEGKFAPGSPRPEGAGRVAGVPNKKSIAIEQILQERAAKQNKTVVEVSAIYRLYLFMDQNDAALGYGKGTITQEQSLEAAKHLSQFEAPKKRAVEVTGNALVGGDFVISTGAAPRKDETEQEVLDRGRLTAEEVELQKKKERLAALEAEKAAEREASAREKG